MEGIGACGPCSPGTSFLNGSPESFFVRNRRPNSVNDMRFVKGIMVALLVAVVSGCGTAGPTASYDASSNRMLYESAEMNVAQLEAAVGSGSSIVMRAFASCTSQNCTPQTVQFIFAVQGPGKSAIADHSLSIIADGSKYSWRGEQNWESQGDVLVSEEPMVRVALPLSSVKQIANAASIEAYMGSMTLNLGGRTQSKLRSFVQTIRNPSSAESS